MTAEKRDQYDFAYNSMHEDPDTFFVQIDAMDQSKTILPHWSQYCKDAKKQLLLHIHLTCVKYCNQQPDDIYYYTDCFPHDAANTATVIYLTLLKVGVLYTFFLGTLRSSSLFSISSALLLPQEIKRRGKPPKLFRIQADNTCRENKNRWIYAFLQFLVEKGFADEIHLCTNLVG